MASARHRAGDDAGDVIVVAKVHADGYGLCPTDLVEGRVVLSLQTALGVVRRAAVAQEDQHIRTLTRAAGGRSGLTPALGRSGLTPRCDEGGSDAQHVAGVLHIALELRAEGIDTGEALLAAQEVHEAHSSRLAVEIVVEVDEMRL